MPVIESSRELSQYTPISENQYFALRFNLEGDFPTSGHILTGVFSDQVDRSKILFAGPWTPKDFYNNYHVYSENYSEWGYLAPVRNHPEATARLICERSDEINGTKDKKSTLLYVYPVSLDRLLEANSFQAVDKILPDEHLIQLSAHTMDYPSSKGRFSALEISIKGAGLTKDGIELRHGNYWALGTDSSQNNRLILKLAGEIADHAEILESAGLTN